MVYLAKGKYAFINEALAIDFCKIYSRLVELEEGRITRYFEPKIEIKKVDESEVGHIYTSLDELEQKNPNLKIKRLKNEKAWLCSKIRLPEEFDITVNHEKRPVYVNFRTLKSLLKSFQVFIKDRKIPKEDEKFVKVEIFSSYFRIHYDSKSNEKLNEYEKLKNLYEHYQSKIKTIDRGIETVKMDLEDEADAIDE